MSKINFAILLIIAVVIAGCRNESGVTYTPPALEENWSVKMTLSGGIAGVLRTIDVLADGKYMATDQRANHSVEGNLTDDELAQLEEMVSTLEFTAPKIPGVCADCFVYDLEIESGGKKMIVRADDVSLGDSGIGSLVQFLREVMDSALK